MFVGVYWSRKTNTKGLVEGRMEGHNAGVLSHLTTLSLKQKLHENIVKSHVNWFVAVICRVKTFRKNLYVPGDRTE